MDISFLGGFIYFVCPTPLPWNPCEASVRDMQKARESLQAMLDTDLGNQDCLHAVSHCMFGIAFPKRFIWEDQVSQLVALTATMADRISKYENAARPIAAKSKAKAAEKS